MDKITKWLMDNCIELLVWIVVYFSPTFESIFTIGCFVVADTILGIAANVKKLDDFQSRKLYRAPLKFSAYGIGILVAYKIQITFMPGFEAMKTIAALVAFVEVKSIDENIKKITGYSIFKMILEKLKVSK